MPIIALTSSTLLPATSAICSTRYTSSRPGRTGSASYLSGCFGSSPAVGSVVVKLFGNTCKRKTGDIGRCTAIISNEWIKQQYGNNTVMDYYIGLKSAHNMSEEEAASYANTLAQQLKISDENVIIRSTYFNLKDENHGDDMLFYFLIGFITFNGSGIVIDGLSRGKTTCCYWYPYWFNYWKHYWVFFNS